MAKITLNKEEINPGDCVYDICYGPGTVQAIDCGKILVSFGSRGRPRQYSQNGFTGKNCQKTLFHRPPAIIEFPKDECRAAKITKALKDVIHIFNCLTNEPCVVEVNCNPCEPENPCDQWQ